MACGFDVLGLAMERPGDVVTAEWVSEPGVHVLEIEGDDGRLPRSPEENTASVAARKLLVDSRWGEARGGGIGLRVRKGLPLESGLGSSAASAVGAIVAVNDLLELGASAESLLRAAVEGERLVSGSAHADNAAACLFGGLVLVRSLDPLDVIRLPVPAEASVAVVRPHLEMNTRDARVLLGDRVSLQAATSQWANLGALVAGLYRRDWDLVSRALTDSVAEPVRAPHVPGFTEVKRAALDAGALGASLSGSGPSLFALCRDLETAARAGDAMQGAFRESGGVESEVYVSRIGAAGARVVEDEEPACDS